MLEKQGKKKRGRIGNIYFFCTGKVLYRKEACEAVVSQFKGKLGQSIGNVSLTLETEVTE